jgi:hypothetical protein
MNKSNKLKKSKKYKFRKNTRKIMGGVLAHDYKSEIKKGIVQALDDQLSSLDDAKKTEFVEKYKKKITESLKQI